MDARRMIFIGLAITILGITVIAVGLWHRDRNHFHADVKMLVETTDSAYRNALTTEQIKFLDRHAPGWQERVRNGESLTFNMNGEGVIKFEPCPITYIGTKSNDDSEHHRWP